MANRHRGAVAGVPRWPDDDGADRGLEGALNRNVPRVFNPERKDHHWGKRKLKRDQ
jgi:hypothetical protein